MNHKPGLSGIRQHIDSDDVHFESFDGNSNDNPDFEE